ncbi:MAG TPA: DUF952 domain-containing protein [Puia sp.]|nr:DUF952 domain-containing protein [Puia sp.]
MSTIYHLTTREQWQQAKEKGQYTADSLADEGFIHASEERQVAGVLERYFKGRSGLLKLHIETDKLKSPLYYDWSPSIEDTFPHIYGPINLEAVIEAEEV